MRAKELCEKIQKITDIHGDFPIYVDGNFYYEDDFVLKMTNTEVGLMGTIEINKPIGFYKK